MVPSPNWKMQENWLQWGVVKLIGMKTLIASKIQTEVDTFFTFYIFCWCLTFYAEFFAFYQWFMGLLGVALALGPQADKLAWMQRCWRRSHRSQRRLVFRALQIIRLAKQVASFPCKQKNGMTAKHTKNVRHSTGSIGREHISCRKGTVPWGKEALNVEHNKFQICGF